jgi:undecaprenyl-diphosphatase
MNYFRSRFQTIDEAVFTWVSSLPHSRFFWWIATIIHLITWGGIVYFPFIIYFSLYPGTRTFAKSALLAIALTFALNDIVLKTLFKRPRPYEGNPDADPLPFPPESYSFPSGQSATASTMAVITILFYPVPVVMVGGLLSMLIVGFDRIYTRHHYLSDVLGGFVVGIVVGILTYYLAPFI